MGADAPLLCDACREKLLHLRLPPEHRAMRRAPAGLDAARAVFPYTGEARALVVALKYGDTRAAAVCLAQFLAQDAAELSAGMIVPVPLHRRRLRQRGYNQAALLGAELSALLSVPMATDALARTRATRPQVGESREERLQNVRGAFEADAARVRGQHVLLLDDVRTTGATAMACAEALRLAGAAGISLLTVCRA